MYQLCDLNVFIDFYLKILVHFDTKYFYLKIWEVF